MRFGTRKADVVEIESDSFNPYLRNLKTGDTIVRFLEDPDEWISYREHFLEKRSFPCTQDDSCKGCEEGDKSKRKYATNLYLVEAGLVLPFKLPVTLAKKMFLRAERNDGVVTDRDFILIRQGEGMNTEYEVDPDDRSKRDIRTLLKDKEDIEAILVSSYEEMWGSVDSEKPKKSKKSKDSWDEPGDETAPWEKDELDEADVRKMTRVNLIKLAKNHDIDVDRDGSKAEILDTILTTAG